jgi:hypothetical protein
MPWSQQKCGKACIKPRNGNKHSGCQCPRAPPILCLVPGSSSASSSSSQPRAANERTSCSDSGATEQDPPRAAGPAAREQVLPPAGRQIAGRGAAGMTPARFASRDFVVPILLGSRVSSTREFAHRSGRRRRPTRRADHRRCRPRRPRRAVAGSWTLSTRSLRSRSSRSMTRALLGDRVIVADGSLGSAAPDDSF